MSKRYPHVPYLCSYILKHYESKSRMKHACNCRSEVEMILRHMVFPSHSSLSLR